MQAPRIGLVALIIGGALTASAAHAADPSQPSPIAGQSVMGDKSRSGPDGWAWAPVTRDKAPAGRAPGQTQANGAPNASAGANNDKTLPPGQDPATPASPAANGPGTLDAQTAAKKP